MFNLFLKVPWIGVGLGIIAQIHYLLLKKFLIIPRFVPILGGLTVPFFPDPITMPFEQWIGSVVLVLLMLFGVPRLFFGEGKRPKPRLWDFCFTGFLAILLFYQVF